MISNAEKIKANILYGQAVKAAQQIAAHSTYGMAKPARTALEPCRSVGELDTQIRELIASLDKGHYQIIQLDRNAIAQHYEPEGTLLYTVGSLTGVFDFSENTLTIS